MSTNQSIQDMKARAESQDIWEYSGMTLFVLHKTYDVPKDTPVPVLRVMRDGHWNGYVLTPIYIPESATYELNVHGGLTLCEHGDGINLYGFDTAHVDDEDNPKSREWVMEETRKLADEILTRHQ